MSFINSVDNNTDPVIESTQYQLINYVGATSHQVSYSGFTLGGGATMSLEVGETTRNIVMKAENYVRYNLFYQNPPYYDGDNHLSYLYSSLKLTYPSYNSYSMYLNDLKYRTTEETMPGMTGPYKVPLNPYEDEIENEQILPKRYYGLHSALPHDYKTSNSNDANNSKDNYINLLKINFLDSCAWIKGKIALYDALLNDIDIEDVQDLITIINILIIRNDYLVYQFLNQMLAIHTKTNSNALGQAFGHINHSVTGLHSNFYPVKELFLSAIFNKLVSTEPESDELHITSAESNRELTLLENVIYYIKYSSIIPDTNTSYNYLDAVYTYEQMLRLNEDLEIIFDVVPFIPVMNVNIITILNSILDLKTTLVNEMDIVRYEAEKVLINVSRITNELPYIVGDYMRDKNNEYNTNVKPSIRLRTQNLPENAQWGVDQGSYRRR